MILLLVGGWGINSSNTNTIVYVGGAFTSVASGVVAQYIAAYDSVNFVWNIVGSYGQSTLTARVRTLHYPGQNQGIGNQDTILFIGGEFSTAGIQDYYSNHGILSSVNRIISFRELGSFTSCIYDTLPYSSTPASSGGPLYSNNTTGVSGSSVDSILYIGTNTLIVGGLFSSCFSPVPNPQLMSHNIAIIKLNNPWENMSSAQIPALSGGAVNAISRVGSKIYVGGSFTNLVSNNQVLNRFAYWDTSTYLWYSIGGLTNTIGVNDVIYTMELFGTINLLVGGAFTTANTTGIIRIGNFNTSSEVWAMPGTGVNNIVRDIYYTSGTTAYICGDFTATGDGVTPIYRVAKFILSPSLQILPIANTSNTHIGLNGPVYSNVFLTPRIYFGGGFTNTSATADLSMQNLAYYITTTTTIPLQVTTSAVSGFLNTENGTTYTIVTIPTRYKLIVIIYNSSLNQWLVTYRSTGVTFS